MRVRRVEGDGAGFFRRHESGRPLSACVGVDEASGGALRLEFGAGGGHVLVVGRSAEAALGILVMMLFDLATQVTGAADRGSAYTTPPFSVMDFHGSEGARVFGEAAMALPLPVKLERATDTAMTTLSDFQYELTRRGEPGAPSPAKFLFLCGLQSAHGIRSRGAYAEDGANPGAARFGRLLREGPANSLHLITWCNSFANIDLTVAEGLGFFRHVIVLDGAGPGQGLEVPDGDGERAWYLDVGEGRAVPMTPFALPAADWCESFARGLG
ncbi:hypothetical protein [Kitasatospora sp. SUK 42]|uniref:hypothetical protein n=1 Tax=Kitasatospora sp. SUK 42 TaxID=1588882 RepID=UPI0018CB63DD|nr:hypothetical protein [Kitasatospora sp. SUK 42]MBV2154747.1 hypothetical protein [Kitasatospora sp. SUK 42]